MTRRETDPAARRLIDDALRLEREPWPDALIPYHATLTALACRCETAPGQAEFYQWGLRVVGPLLAIPDDRLREHRHDALADIAVDSFTWLSQRRAGLHPSIKPNLRSMLATAVRWKAHDAFESTHRRHARRRGYANLDHLTAPGTPYTAALARESVALLSGSDTPAARALLLVAQGETVSEAARRTGVSRATIYRAIDRIRG